MKLRWITALCSAVLLSLQTAPVLAQTTPASQSATLRMVVLPFRNLTRQPEDEWLSESFSEHLTTMLTQSARLQLVERSQIQLVLQEQSFTQSVFADAATAPELGKLLGASKILLGNYQKIGDQLVVNTRVVDVSTGQIDSASATQVQGAYSQLLDVQNRLAQALLQSFSQAPLKSTQMTHSNPAYKNYCQALLLSRVPSERNLQQALALLQSALEQDPEFGLAHAMISELLSKRAQDPTAYPSARPDDLPRALTHASRALELKAPPANVYRALASAYQARGEHTKALETIENALQELPGDTDLILAYLNVQTELDANALQARLRQLNVNISEPWVQLALGSRYLSQLKYELEPDPRSTLNFLQAARQALPEHPLIPLKLAEVAVLQRNYAQAEELAQAALALDPQNFLLYFLAAQTLLYGPNQAQVQQWFEKSLELNPQFGYARMSLGYVHWRNDRLEQALADFKRAEAIFPESSALAFVRGKYAFAQRDYSQARQYLLEALQRWGQTAGERVSRGALYIKLGDIEADAGQWQQALSYYRQATAEERDIKSLAYLKISRLQALQASYTEALQNFQTYLKLSPYRDPELVSQDQQSLYLLQQGQMRPEDPALHNDLGRLALLAQDYAVAEQHFQQALVSAPDNASIHYNYSLLLMYQQQWPAAISRLQTVLRLNPEHDKAWYNLGLAYLNQGQTAQARQTWQALLQREPGHLRAQEALTQLP